MWIIGRYVSQELAKIFAICLGAFISIYFVIDFFEKVDDFLESDLPISLALEYFLLKLPLMAQQGIPMGVLMGTLIVLGLAARSNEITALKASGANPLLVAGPVILVALLLSILDFALAEYLVPLTSTRANYIWSAKVKKRPAPSSFTQEKLWYKSGQTLYNIRVLHPKRQMMEGVTIYKFDRNFHLVNRLDARRGQWDGEVWIFSDGVFLSRTDDGNFTMKRFRQRRMELNERPDSFQHLEKLPEEMTLGELGRYVSKIKSEGYDATRYRVDFHAKIAFPFTSVIMALMGIGIALYQGKRGGIAVGVAVSVALAFIYILIFQLVLSVAYAGNLHPLLAAWTPNIFFAMIGMLLFIHAMH
jgi:lipopolysaccharide export system permease protein